MTRNCGKPAESREFAASQLYTYSVGKVQIVLQVCPAKAIKLIKAACSRAESNLQTTPSRQQFVKL